VADKGWKEGAIDETSYFLAYLFPRVTNYSDCGGSDFAPCGARAPSSDSISTARPRSATWR
jgi:hypothetical protein